MDRSFHDAGAAPAWGWPTFAALMFLADRDVQQPTHYGCMQILPLDVPMGTDAYSVTLREEASGEVRLAAVYSAGMQVRLSHLRADRAYRVTIEARAADMWLATAQSAPLWLDPQRQDFVLPLRFGID